MFQILDILTIDDKSLESHPFQTSTKQYVAKVLKQTLQKTLAQNSNKLFVETPRKKIIPFLQI